jgi:3',5'-cyclic AMP phosphodiesterase CpdA
VKLVVHISDPHFGAHDPAIAAALLDDLNGHTAPRPALVAISGDVTQRARSSQFEQARRFLAAIEVPYLVVPGNHDIPMFDVFRRLFRSRTRYCRYITSDLSPFYADDHIAAAGIDTAKRFTIKDGEVRREQVEAVCERFQLHAQRWKILVAHHPFVVPESLPDDDKDLVNGHEMAVPMLEAAGVDVILSGHLHVPYTEDVAGRNEHHTIIAVHAGSCMSTRLRGHPNGYNQLCFEGTHCTITPRHWDGTRFVDGHAKAYRRGRGTERLVRDEQPLHAGPPPQARYDLR